MQNYFLPIQAKTIIDFSECVVYGFRILHSTRIIYSRDLKCYLQCANEWDEMNWVTEWWSDCQMSMYLVSAMSTMSMLANAVV